MLVSASPPRRRAVGKSHAGFSPQYAAAPLLLALFRADCAELFAAAPIERERDMAFGGRSFCHCRSDDMFYYAQRFLRL